MSRRRQQRRLEVVGPFAALLITAILVGRPQEGTARRVPIVNVAPRRSIIGNGDVRGLAFDPDPSSYAGLNVRGGVQRRSSSSSTNPSKGKTATGKKKVGAASAAEKEKTKSSPMLERYKKMLPITRWHLTSVAVVTLLGVPLGDLTQELFAFDANRVLQGFQVWRPITAASFMGPPSISWVTNGYYLYQYGSSLERAFGTAQHLIFLLSQLVILSILVTLLRLPFFAISIVTAMLHVLSRATPNQESKWIMFKVPYWTLPYGLMASAVLEQQSLMAAIPHILGVLSGHFYYFHKNIWPKRGGEDWLVAPDFLTRRLDSDAKIYDNAVSSKGKGTSRKPRKGRKLGGG